MKRLFNSSGGLIVLIALLLAAITLVVSLFLSGANPAANLWGLVTTPFRSAGTAVAEWTERTFTNRYRVETLEEEVERLRQELAATQQQLRDSQDATVENENLRALLGLRQKRSDLTELESATITARSLSNWESSLTISQGSNYGRDQDQ